MKLLFYIFITIYSYIKLLFGIQPGLLKKIPYPKYLLTHACLIITSIIIMLSLLFVFLIIQTFLFGLDLWLILKLGQNYGGRLPGVDVAFECGEEKTAIACLLILNHNERKNDFDERIKKLFEKVHNSSPKLSCVVENCLGFSYYVKNQIKSSDCCFFTKINDKDCVSRDEILDYIETNCSKNLCNGNNLWYGEIFTQNVSWGEKNHKKLILIAFRHCLGDGPSLIGLINKFATFEKPPIIFKFDQKYNSKPAFSLDNCYVYHNIFKHNHNNQEFDVINNERFVGFYSESSTKFFPLIKKIKNKIGVGFTEVLIAGLTCSLEKVLNKNGKKIDKCKIGVMFRPIDENLISMINGSYNYNELKNNSTIILINAPITIPKGSKMMDRLKYVGQEMSQAKYAIDGIATHSLYNIVHIFPAFFIKYCTKTVVNITLGVTNVGGMRGMKLAGCDVEDGFIFIPQFHNTHFILLIFTYNGRLHLGLSTVGVLQSRQEVQEVLDDVLPYIDKLSHELDVKLN